MRFSHFDADSDFVCCANSLRFKCDMMVHSGVESPESDDYTPYSTPLTSPCSSSGYETCLSLLDDLSLFDIDFDSSDGGQDLFTDNKDEDIEEFPGDTGLVSSGTENLKYEIMPQNLPDISESNNRSEGHLTGDGIAGPSKDTGMELIHISLPSSEKNEDLHKDTECKYVLTEGNAICNLGRGTCRYPLHITIPESGETEVPPAEIEKTGHHEGVCIENGAFSSSKNVGTNSPLKRNLTTYLDKKVSNSQLIEDSAESSLKENEVIKPSSVEIEEVRGLPDKENLPGCTTVIGTSEGSLTENGTVTPLEYDGTETSDLITKLKPSEDILSEVGTSIALEDVVNPPAVISTKCNTQPPDDLGPENSKVILPEEGSNYSLQVVGTEPSNVCVSKSDDSSSSSESTEILVEHIENISIEGICTNTEMSLLPHDVDEVKPNNEDNSPSSSGSTEIPVSPIENDLLEGICPGTGDGLPPEVISTKHVLIEEDAQSKLASTASQKMDAAALLDENSEALVFSPKPVAYILPEPLISSFGTDPDMWAPPELAGNGTQLQSDDDEEEKEDESKYGMNLVQPKPEDEVNEKAMVEIMNGEFKRLLKRFMVAEGFSVPDEAGDEGAPDSWLRVVRVLSWQAALLIKPDLVAGKEMDPSLYVKVKCIASGTRIQSEVIDGLVFKKSAAHKHMPTRIRNPRLLLLHEVLDHSVSGLSSIKSMEHDKDVLEKLIKTMLDTCQPNIILVEKAASREAQELIRKEGITLVLDMKLHRMARIVRCTGLKVVSLGEALTRPRAVNECDNFRIEKFVEDINSEGKKPNKNLLFLEGLPKPLGCTILLRGANIEELKRIKRVLHYAVFAAHHLVRVTSFLSDQRLLASCTDALRKQNSLLVFPETEPTSPCRSLTSDTSTDCSTLSQDLEIPISDEELPLVLSDIPLRTDSTSPELVADCLNVITEGAVVEMATNEETRIIADPEKEGEDTKDPHSALIIASCRNIVKRTICEERHVSRINYYGNSDTTLATQLKDVFLNEKHRCSKCGDAPEAHLYVYTHRNGRITVLVTTLPPKLDLSRGTSKDQDKIWMWTRCWRCKKENRPVGPAVRYIVSDSARSISFVKFLEVSFSRYLPGTKLSCGHLMYHDGLRFLGMGSKVAMLRYTPVEVYEACKPPAMLEFHDINNLDWLQKEALLVSEKRALLCSEVKRIVEELKQRCSNDTAFAAISRDLVLLMAQETDTRVEVSLPNPMDSADKVNKKPGGVVQDILSLNWLYQTLLLETYVCDCCLSHLKKSEEKLERSLGTSENIYLETNGAKGSNEPPSSIEVHSHEIVPVFEGSSLETTLLDLDTNPELDGTLNLSDSTIHDKDAGIGAPFSNLLMSYRKELEDGSLNTFNLINSYIPPHLPQIQNLKQDSEPQRQFFVGPGGNILSISEDEVSSLIAYSLCVNAKNGKGKAEPDIRKLDSSVLSGGMLSITPEEFLSTSKHLHPEVSIGKDDSFSLKGKYTITCVYADQFNELRRKCCPSEIMYIGSLSRCKRWNAQGGKTKAFFSKTMDDRFIIKGIKKIEFDSFLQFARHYFSYMSESVEKGNQTCLAKILGIYQILEVRNGKETRMDLMVMENLLYGRHLSRTYDLKGVIYARHVTGSDSCTFLDQNFIEDMRECPIYLSQRTKKLFERAIWNDTSFLTSINVMDYSLLLAVDRENRAIVFGIIDYLRQYTWDKQLETWVKSSLVVPKNELPTIVSPKEYKKRFRKFMQQYVLTVPDGWGSEMVNSPWILS